MVWNALRNGAGWDPWREITEFRSHLDRLVSGGALGSVRGEPPVEIWSREDGIRLYAQVPGLAADSLELSVVGDTLTLKGNRNEPVAQSFARSIRLPFAVDGDGAKARFEDGILEVELPRSPSTKPRKITVRSD